MGRHLRGQGDEPSASYQRPDGMALDGPPDPAAEALRAKAEQQVAEPVQIDRVDPVDAYDSQMITGHDGNLIEPRLLAVVRNARDVFGAEALAYAAISVDLPDQGALWKTLGLTAPDGETWITIPVREPRVLLAWGDGTITEITDDSHIIRHGFQHPTDLQRKLMSTRLRYLADLLQYGPELTTEDEDDAHRA